MFLTGGYSSARSVFPCSFSVKNEFIFSDYIFVQKWLSFYIIYLLFLNSIISVNEQRRQKRIIGESLALIGIVNPSSQPLGILFFSYDF